MTEGCVACAAEAAADELRIDGITSMADVIVEIEHEFRHHDCGRFEVVRTKYTDRRKPIPRGTRILVLKRDNFRCVWCGKNERLCMDHVVPWSAGGSDTVDNLRTLCWDCNEFRSNFGSSLDLSFRHLQTGRACVYCTPDLLGDPDLRPVYCMNCRTKASGIRAFYLPMPGWEDQPLTHQEQAHA